MPQMRAGAALGRTEHAELGRTVEQPVAVAIQELVTQAGVADRILEIGQRVR